ncbi:unnamed protein product [Phaeothamnion confervicola]
MLPTGESTPSKSAAQLFAEYQYIAGFEDTGKSLLSTIRGLVESALDSAEVAGILPEISVTVVEHTRNEMVAAMAESGGSSSGGGLGGGNGGGGDGGGDHSGAAVAASEGGDGSCGDDDDEESGDALAGRQSNGGGGGDASASPGAAAGRSKRSTAGQRKSWGPPEPSAAEAVTAAAAAAFGDDAAAAALAAVGSHREEDAMMEENDGDGGGGEYGGSSGGRSGGSARRAGSSAGRGGSAGKASAAGTSPAAAAATAAAPPGEMRYYLVACRDNAGGVWLDDAAEFLWHGQSVEEREDFDGVKQARGKFDGAFQGTVHANLRLGAKLALIWCAKSTGMPIEVRTSGGGAPDGGGGSAARVMRCLLDVDLSGGAPPEARARESLPNPEGWRGLEIAAFAGGDWRSCGPLVLRYMQQVAIVTPYAQMDFSFRRSAAAEIADDWGDISVRYERRSEQMPRPPQAVQHHPGSVDRRLLQRMLQRTSCRTLLEFLCTELAGLKKPLARRIVSDIGLGLGDATPPAALAPDDAKVDRLVQVLRTATEARPPDGACLSPTGEYNLWLGIVKEMRTQYVATTTERLGVYDGHPFIIEAGISLGGHGSGHGGIAGYGGGYDGEYDGNYDAVSGVRVFRFANRVPLLFDGADDVATHAAQKVRWQLYKVEPRRHRIAVFVSITSTKVPFRVRSGSLYSRVFFRAARAVTQS